MSPVSVKEKGFAVGDQLKGQFSYPASKTRWRISAGDHISATRYHSLRPLLMQANVDDLGFPLKIAFPARGSTTAGILPILVRVYLVNYT